MNQRKAGVLLSYLVIIINAIVGLLYVPILLSYMSQNEYGLYRLMGSIVIYLAIMDFGLSTIITRFYTTYRLDQDTIKTENVLALSVIICTAVVLFIITIGSIFYFSLSDIFQHSLSSNELVSAKKIYLLLLMNLALTFFGNMFNAIIASHEKFILLKSLTLVQILAQPLIIIQVMSFSPYAFSLVLVQSLFNACFVLAKIFYCFKKIKIKIRYHYFDIKLLRSMGTLSISMFIVAVTDQIFWNANQIILGVLSGTAVVAIYAIASQIYMNYLSIATVFMGIFLPKVTVMVKNNVPIEDFSALLIRVGRLQLFLLAAILSGFILFGQEFIQLWAGESFNDAYFIAMIIMLPFTINLIQTMGVVILQAKNQYGFRACTYFGVGIFNIVLAIPIAKEYGGVGCALLTAICYLIGDGLIMNIYYAKKIHLSIKEFWRQIIKIVILIGVCMLFGASLHQLDMFTPMMNLLVKIILYVGIYVLAMWRFAFNSYEKNLLKQGLFKIQGKFLERKNDI